MLKLVMGKVGGTEYPISLEINRQVSLVKLANIPIILNIVSHIPGSKMDSIPCPWK